MTEYDIFLPLSDEKGKAYPDRVLQKIKDTLLQTLGGYTEITHGIEGAWRVGDVTFHDQICIVRVVKTEEKSFDMWRFKEYIAAALGQEQVLIISRQVKVV